MLLALVLAAAPVTISLTADTVSVDGQVVQAPFDDGLWNLPAVEQAVRAKRTDKDPLAVRFEVTGGTTYLRLRRVMFTAGAAGADSYELRLEGAEPFFDAVGTPRGLVRIGRNDVWLDDRPLTTDAGVLDGALLSKQLGEPRDDAPVGLVVDDAVPMRVLVPVVKACRSAGYALSVMGRSVGRAPPSAVAALVTQGSLKKELITGVIRANRGMVRFCYEALLLKQPAAAGKVKVKFTISASGDVTTAAVEEDSLGSAELAQCLTKAVKRWVFPKPAGGGVVIVNYPFVFAPQ